MVRGPGFAELDLNAHAFSYVGRKVGATPPRKENKNKKQGRGLRCPTGARATVLHGGGIRLHVV